MGINFMAHAWRSGCRLRWSVRSVGGSYRRFNDMLYVIYTFYSINKVKNIVK